MSLLGIDVGTTGCKVIAFDLEGKILASSYQEYPLIYPKPGWMELDGELIWKKVAGALKDVASKVSRDPIEALSVSSLGESFVPIDRNGRILDNAIASFDNRTLGYTRQLRKKISDIEILKITGQTPSEIPTLHKLLWLKKMRTAVFKKIWKILCFEDFILFKLGGITATDYSLAARTMAFDMNTKKWSERLLGITDISPFIFPSLYPSGTVVGEVSKKVADEVGLPTNTKLVTGGHDQPCGALGTGVVKSVLAVDATGTVESIAVSLDKPVLNNTMVKNNLCCYPHTAEGKFVSLVYNFTGGSLLRWYRDTFGEYEIFQARKYNKDIYDIILRDVKNTPSPLLVLPHFAGTGTPYFDFQTKGAILGLTLGTSKNDFIRGLLEGVTFEMKLNLEIWEKVGIKLKRLRVIGGGAKSDLWMQLKADVFEKDIDRPNVTEAGALGAAILAGIAIGKYSSIYEATENLVKVKQTFHPNPENVRRYNERFLLYKEMYPTLKGLLAKT